MTTFYDPVLEAAKRAILDALRVNGGRCTPAALAEGAALMPDGRPVPFNLVGRSCRSLATEGRVVRRVERLTIVWQLTDGGEL